MVVNSSPDRILLIRPSALGDVCRTVPVLASLRAAWPKASIHWVVQDAFADAVRAHPGLDEVIAFPRRDLAKWWKPAVARRAMAWFGQLHARQYDLVLDCQGLGRSGLMSWITRAPMRVGHRSARELAWLGYNRRVGDRRAEPIHTVDAMLQLVDDLGITPSRDMTLHPPPEDLAWWQARQTELELTDGAFAVLAPSSRWLSKRWPIERWIELIDPLQARGLQRCVVLAAPGEESQLQPLAERAENDQRIVNMTGQTTVGQTMAVIASAGLVIANDSAPLHMAVGLHAPSVGLFGPTDPAIVGPYEQPMHIVRGEDHRKSEKSAHFKDAQLGDALMRLISVESVLEQADRALHSG